jgi:hypothetical protein
MICKKDKKKRAEFDDSGKTYKYQSYIYCYIYSDDGQIIQRYTCQGYANDSQDHANARGMAKFNTKYEGFITPQKTNGFILAQDNTNFKSYKCDFFVSSKSFDYSSINSKFKSTTIPPVPPPLPPPNPRPRPSLVTCKIFSSIYSQSLANTLNTLLNNYIVTFNAAPASTYVDQSVSNLSVTSGSTMYDMIFNKSTYGYEYGAEVSKAKWKNFEGGYTIFLYELKNAFNVIFETPKNTSVTCTQVNRNTISVSNPAVFSWVNNKKSEVFPNNPFEKKIIGNLFSLELNITGSWLQNQKEFALLKMPAEIGRLKDVSAPITATISTTPPASSLQMLYSYTYNLNNSQTPIPITYYITNVFVSDSGIADIEPNVDVAFKSLNFTYYDNIGGDVVNKKTGETVNDFIRAGLTSAIGKINEQLPNYYIKLIVYT